MQGSIVLGSQRLEVKIASASSTSVGLSVVLGKTSFQVIRAGDSSYLRANRAFWAEHATPRAAQLADRWIEVSETSSRSLSASLGPFAPDTLARCLTEDHGTLSFAGTTTVGHRHAVVVKDAGNAPGSSPSTLAIASSGPPYPLAYTATGGQRAGGRIDVCNQGKATSSRGTITLDHFGHVSPLRAPKHPLSLSTSPSV